MCMQSMICFHIETVCITFTDNSRGGFFFYCDYSECASLILTLDAFPSGNALVCAL